MCYTMPLQPTNLKYNGVRMYANDTRYSNSTQLICEPSSLFECTDRCAAANATCRAFVIPTRFATSFSPFMNDLSTRMGASGWHVMDVGELAMHLGCVPDVLAFYILNASGYDLVNAWRNKLLNESLRGDQIAGAAWLLITEDLGLIDTGYVLRQAGAWFDGVLARYPESTISLLQGHFHIEPKHRVIHFPHAASEGFLRPLAFDAKTEPVLLSGEIHAHYPLRVRAQALLSTGMVQRRTVTTRTHAFTNPQQEASDYAEAISRYYIAIAGCRQHNFKGRPASTLWLVAKHFEIAAAGTAMLTDTAAAHLLRPLGLLPGIHYIESTPSMLNETLRYWLAPEQREALRNITARGQRVVHKFHTGEARARHLNQVASALWAAKRAQEGGERCPACVNNRLDDSMPGAPCTVPEEDPYAADADVLQNGSANSSTLLS